MGYAMGTAIYYEALVPQSMDAGRDPWPALVWIMADALIVTACIAIAIAILLVLRQRPDVPYRWLAASVAALIALYGISHAIEITTQWVPFAPLTKAIHLATGVVSLVTAVALLRLIPALVRVPVREDNAELIAQLELALADVSRNRDDLAELVKKRTKDLQSANSQLSDMAREATRRSRNLIQIVSSLTRPGSEVKEYSEGFMRELRGRINALATATSTVMEQGNMAHASLDRVIRRQVEPMFAQPERQLRTKGPEIDVCIQGAQQISLVAWELASRFALMSRSKQARGQIAVNWLVSRDQGEADMLVLEWRETFGEEERAPLEYMELGDGTCTPELLTDFSERLLTQIVPHVLGGKGRVEIAPSTFIYRLTCPLNAIDITSDTPFASSGEGGLEQKRAKSG